MPSSNSNNFALFMLCTTMAGIHAFAPHQNMITTNNFHRPSLAMAAKKNKNRNKNKGFGKPKEVNYFDDDDDDDDTSPATTTMAQKSSQDDDDDSSVLNKNYGAEALDRLRRQKAENRNDELRSIRDLQNVDTLLQEEPNAAVIPEQVAQRMGKRMLPFVGVPLFGVMAAFIAFWYFATYKNVEFQPALVAFSTIGILGSGLLGITYSVMSASWDVEEEGSALGVDEFKKNFGSIQDGLKRTRSNAILREKMASVPDEEIDMALKSLEKKEQAEKAKKMTLGEKMDKELN